MSKYYFPKAKKAINSLTCSPSFLFKDFSLFFDYTYIWKTYIQNLKFKANQICASDDFDNL